jgi:hypothetical protein
MAVYIRHATRALKVVVDLGTAHDRAVVWSKCVGLTILDKGTGSFTLTIVYPDGTELELSQDEVLNGDVLQWDMAEIRITNTAQSGKTVKLIVDQQVLP